MATIGELVRDNPFYEQGVFFNKDYYKERIPQGSFTRPIAQHTCDRALVLQALLEGIKKVTLVALVMIPSIYTLGLGLGLSVMGAGAIAAIISTEPKIGDLHLVKQIKLQSDLLAAFTEDQKVAYIAKAVSNDVLLKGVFAVLLSEIPQRFASQLAWAGLFFATYSLVQDIEKLLFWMLESYANKQNEERFRALNLA
ncbi:MAG: hypothetical protein WCG10_02025 [Chlamydiota bacterium]